MNDILLKLTGTQTGFDGEEEKLEFITEGQQFSRNGAYYLRYEESEISGMEGCHTLLRYNESGLRMRRTGAKLGEYTVIEFNKGKSFNSLYHTPFGPIEMSVQTDRYEQELNEEGLGSICIDYRVVLSGLAESKNKLDITISKQ